MPIKMGGISVSGRTKVSELITGDQYFSNVKSLLHFDTDFTDSATHADGTPVWTADSGATITGTPKFGAGAADYDTGVVQTTGLIAYFWGFLSYPTSPWTIDVWISPVSTGDTQTILDSGGQNGSNGLWLSFTPTGALTVQIRGSNITRFTDTSTAGAIAYNTYSFVRITHDSGTIAMNVNGSQVSTKSISMPPGGQPLPMRLGRITGHNNDYFEGSMDELRFTDGVARDGSEVPTAPFPNA